MKAAIILVCILLSACASAEPIVAEHIVVQKPEIPQELLSCDSAPETPAGGYTQRDVAEYVLDLYGAWMDCSRKLTAVGNIVR